jgi:biopolymer transport protein ExbB
MNSKLLPDPCLTGANRARTGVTGKLAKGLFSHSSWAMALIVVLILICPPCAQAAQPSVAIAPATAAQPGPQMPAMNLTVPSLLRDTDALVRVVLILLLAASVLTWTVWVAKSIELARARRRLSADVRALSRAPSLHALPLLISHAGRAVVEALRVEMARAGDLRQPVCAEGLKERATVGLLSVETAQARRMSAGINLIASIGATAPFVGLFGTVWGVMSSFIGIARLQTSNLTAVAPGIAEALLTTAAGLAAAVPAVLIYNGFTRSISGYRTLLADASHAAACLLSLEIERVQLSDTNVQLSDTKARPLPMQEAVRGV